MDLQQPHPSTDQGEIWYTTLLLWHAFSLPNFILIGALCHPFWTRNHKFSMKINLWHAVPYRISPRSMHHIIPVVPKTSKLCLQLVRLTADCYARCATPVNLIHDNNNLYIQCPVIPLELYQADICKNLDIILSHCHSVPEGGRWTDGRTDGIISEYTALLYNVKCGNKKQSCTN